jgi:D-ornithine 4,5-aminomutase subunit alpha
MTKQPDEFQVRRAHLKDKSDAELKAYFLELADRLVDPLLDLAYHNTSKSIERSVLLRMGFSSIEAKAIVDVLNEKNLLRKGAGHCVYVVSKRLNIPIRDAGLALADGNHFDILETHFKEVRA